MEIIQHPELSVLTVRLSTREAIDLKSGKTQLRMSPEYEGFIIDYFITDWDGLMVGGDDFP